MVHLRTNWQPIKATARSALAHGCGPRNNERVCWFTHSTLAGALAATIGEIKSALQGRMQKEQRSLMRSADYETGLV